MKMVKLLSVLFVLSLVFTGCKDYGKKIVKDSIEIYYKDGVTADQAQNAANLLAASVKTKDTKSIQLIKKNDVYCYRMVTDKDKLASSGMPDETFFQIGNEISDNIFNGAPVNVELTDDKFETFKTFPFKKTAPVQEIMPQPTDVPAENHVKMQEDTTHLPE